MSFLGHSIPGGIGRHIRTRIIAGLLLLVPLMITYLILRFLFDNIDDLLQPAIQFLGRTIPGGEVVARPGAGVVALILIVYLVGLLGTNVLGAGVIRLGERLVARIPIVRGIYGTSKQLIFSFSGSGTTGFKRVVAVEFPRLGVWSVAFLTGMTSDEEGRLLAVVYIPTAPMPNSGYVNIMPVDQVYELNISVQTAMSLVLSGGINSPEQFHKTPLRPLDVEPPASEGRAQ